METDEKGGSWRPAANGYCFARKDGASKEVDLIFGAYAQGALFQLDETALDQFEALLSAPDQEVYAWLQGAKAGTR